MELEDCTRFEHKVDWCVHAGMFNLIGLEGQFFLSPSGDLGFGLV